MSTPKSQSADPFLESEELFRAAFDASATMMTISKSEDGFCLAANDAWLRVLGYQREEIIGRTTQEIGAWWEPALRGQVLSQLAAGQTVENMETVLRGKSGRLIDCLMSLRPFCSGGQDLLLFSAKEVKEDQATEQAVPTSRALLVDALESINEGFVLYGSDGRLMICNSKFKEFYGYSDEEAFPGVHRKELGYLDLKRKAVVVDGAEEKYYIDRRESLSEGPPESFIVQLKDGRILRLSDRKTDSGGIVSLQNDITELKRAEAAISAAKDEALTANRAKSEFLAHMSHELRTPLNSILGFTQIMKEEVFGPLGVPKYMDYATNVHHSGQHLLALINDILDISKVEAGEVTLDEEVFDLRDSIRTCIRMVTGQSDDAMKRIGFQGTEDTRLFKGDERILKQVILNLLSNATKFTPLEGRIDISTALDASGGVVVRVEDNGCGIAKDDIPKVLEPFGQVRPGVHQAHAGTGLGLSLSKMLTELHGGILSIESELDKGTTVTLRFSLERTVAA
jgi:two-component system cell cycle sensor histidine kinase PleC